jgi:hypothetical protein
MKSHNTVGIKVFLMTALIRQWSSYFMVLANFTDGFRCFSGLFSAPQFQFHGKMVSQADSDGSVQTDMVRPGDNLTDEVNVWGTTYKVGHLIVTEVICQDIIEVGKIEKVVVRGSQVKFLVSLHNCARNSLNIFQSVPQDKLKLVSSSSLADYKPIIKRGQGKSFCFVLHHYLPLMTNSL